MLPLALALAACGGDDENPAADAAVDARPVLPFTPQAYCDTIQAACTGDNQQYPNVNQCLATAAGFPMGTSSTEMTGDTLGCRIYHAQNAMITGDVATHCPHAGPAGEKVNAATGQCSINPCDAFCSLSVAVCGTNADPKVANHYVSKAECMTACAGFEKTTAFKAPAMNGNTMACKVFHLTNAALYKNGTPADPANHNLHCGHTLTPAMGVCI
jgi:hypothetical protein